MLSEEKKEFMDSKGHLFLDPKQQHWQRGIFLMLSLNYPVALCVLYLSFSMPTVLK